MTHNKFTKKIIEREEFLKQLITEAGKFALDYFHRLKEIKIEYKGIQNMVSVADKETEILIRKAIKKQFSRDSIMGEEYGLEKNPSDEGIVWIIDPIDGTNCFLNGIPYWCVSIAIAQGDQVIVGAVYDPIGNELFFSAKGKGSFINEVRVEIRKDITLQNATFALGYKIGVSKENFTQNVANLLNVNGVIFRNGSGALMCVYAGCGRIAGFYEEHINSWDVAAGYLFCVESGVFVNDYYTSDALLNGNRILVCPQHLTEEAKRIVNWVD